MTIVDSRVRRGKLTFSTDDGSGTAVEHDFSCSPTSVSIEPKASDDGDAVEVLCGDSVPPGKKYEYTLKLDAIQDFDDPSGFQNFSWDHVGETVGFTWQPNPKAQVYTGKVVVDPVTVGGEVNKRINTTAEWTIAGQPQRLPAPPLKALTATAAETTPHAGDRRGVTLTVDNTGSGEATKIMWKAGAKLINGPVTGTVDHIYIAADDGPVVITVVDAKDSTRKVTANVTIPFHDPAPTLVKKSVAGLKATVTVARDGATGLMLNWKDGDPVAISADGDMTHDYPDVTAGYQVAITGGPVGTKLPVPVAIDITKQP